MGEINDPNYWVQFRNQSQPLIVTPPVDTTILNNVQSEGAWRITIGCLGTVGISSVFVKFNNGQELTLRPGDPFIILDGQPYVKRDDTFNITVDRGTLVFIRDVIVINKEAPGK